MADSFFSNIAFLGNFHPIIVHFPLALLPVALLFKWWGRPTLQPSANGMLLLTLAFAVASALMGMTNSWANAYTIDTIQTHAGLAWATIAVLAVAIFLPTESTGSATLNTLRKLLHGLAVTIGKLFLLLKYALIILLLPLFLLYLLFRKLYRWQLAKRLNPWFDKIRRKLRTRWSTVTRHWRNLSTLSNWKTLCYGASLVLIAMTGYEGSNLVHGQGHLARHAPTWLAPLLGAQTEENSGLKLDALYYQDHVQPIFRKNCFKCHGEDKAKGNLQLHTIEHVVNARIIEFESPYNSELLKRVLLSHSDPSAMPPVKNGKRLSPTAIATLVAWINGKKGDGAGSGENTELPPAYADIASTLPELSSDSVRGLNHHAAVVTQLLTGHSLLSVNLQFVTENNLIAALEQLQPVVEHIVDLNISGRTLSKSTIQTLSTMQNLVRLNLSRSNISDNDLKQLGTLQNLQWLNLFGTAITAKSHRYFEEMPALKTLFVSGTGIDEAELNQYARWSQD